FVPAGSRPAFSKCEATYSAARLCSGLPVLRPAIASVASASMCENQRSAPAAARWPSIRIVSVSVMAATSVTPTMRPMKSSGANHTAGFPARSAGLSGPRSAALKGPPYSCESRAGHSPLLITSGRRAVRGSTLRRAGLRVSPARIDDVDGDRSAVAARGQRVAKHVMAALRIVVGEREVERAVGVEIDPLHAVAGVV